MPKGYPLSLDDRLLTRLYRKDKLSVRKIAEQLGCAHMSIHNRLKALGITREVPWKVFRRRTPSVRQMIHWNKNNGISLLRIAKRYQISENRVSELMRAAGYTPRHASVYNTKECSTEEMVFLYVTKRWTGQQIANLYKITADAVYGRLRKAGICMRGRGPYSRVLRRKRDGRVVRFDSSWEFRMYTLLHRAFGEEVLFQGETGSRVHLRPAPLLLRKPAAIRRAYAPNKAHYRWMPDFFVPSQNLIVEVKGEFRAAKSWDSVLLPTLRKSKPDVRIAVVCYDPFEAKTWEEAVVYYV